MAERLSITTIALFGFLTISLGVEVSVPIILVVSGLCRLLPAMGSPLSMRREKQRKDPAIEDASPVAQTLCSASP